MNWIGRVMLAGILMAWTGWVGAAEDETALASPQHAQPDHTQALQHHQRVREWTAAQRELAADDPEIWVGPGIRADRNRQEVTFWAEATGLTPDVPVEFLIIDELSGHDYEALAISYTRPSDVYTALSFLGLPPGQPYMPRELRFFPKGERVRVRFRWSDEAGEPVERSAESLIRYLRTGTSLAETGFTFVGSQWLEMDGERVLAADRTGPQAIISLYNEPTTVLDLPRAAGQQRLYGFLQAYPDRQPAYGTLLEIVMQPEYPDGHRRVRDVTLRVDVSESESGVMLQLEDEDGEPLHADPSLAGVLATFERYVDAGQTPFVQVESTMSVPLVELRDIFRWLRTFQDEDVLFIEPPVGNELFYRSFLPNETHRDRAERPSQALELRIPFREADEPTRVVEIRDQRSRIDDEFDPDILTHTVSDPASLVERLDEINHRLPVLLVFAPSRLTLGELMTWLGPVRETHPIVHVFLE